MPKRQPASRVRRRTVACARCRTRKIMCDARSPSCSKCLEAGIRCLASGVSKERTAPRSIVQFLEQKLGKSRKAIQQDTPSVADQVIADMTTPFLGLTSAIPLVRCAVAGTRLPSTTLLEVADSNGVAQQPALDPTCQPMTGLSAIPITVADFLFENYMTRVVAQYPIFYSTDLVAYFNSVFHNSDPSLEAGASSTPREIYIISLIMAISLTTAARAQQVWANSIATGLFRQAMQHIRPVFTNDISGLQALLLLLQYTNLDPTAANVWLLAGFTTQACIDMGLHRETPQDRAIDPLGKDIRRRVFWCTYEMEIATSAALLRPSSFFNVQISVPFPTELDDSSLSVSGIDRNGDTTMFAAHRIWQYRQIEGEILSVLFHPRDESVPHESNDALKVWMDAIEGKINSWNHEVHWSASLNTDPQKISQWEEMCLYADIARDYIIVTLFRPSPRIKEPTCDNLMKAFLAGIGVAGGYWKQSNLGFGNSKYVFHTCYHTFSAAIVFLRAVQRCKEIIFARYTLQEVETFIASFSRLFTTIAERWPAASRCLEEFERLMAPVKREYIDFTVEKARNISQGLAYDDMSAFGEDEDPMLLHSAWQLDSMNFEPLLAPGWWEYDAPDLSLQIPIDWNAEFDFGMD
ncbi:hypothetical protein FE257_011324 [Aspergillus nanangensis]|uniref:Zn(2)-C6 fungal-type domain-containing protein n=1 Tax=Aspergillus nanangensis TaxID=2582783 RepID=A0AAD4CHR5_ASPNN|nr:hypothetical protein FE257_011324 [Aspergillus nanangensis]